MRVCGECEHYATTRKDRLKGACMAFLRQVDGRWGYHPGREYNRCACGFFRERGKS